MLSPDRAVHRPQITSIKNTASPQNPSNPQDERDQESEKTMASGAPSSKSWRERRLDEPAGSGDGGPECNGPDLSADVVIGQVVRPVGRRGEVAVEPLTDDPDRFFEIESAEVGPAERPGRWRSLDAVRIHKGRPVVLFDGIGDIGAAETLRGMEVRIRESERAALPDDRYYSDELVGCRAESKEGALLGEIVGTLDTAGPTLLVLRAPDGSEDLIPFVEALCVLVEPEAGRVVLNVPDGLLGLNAPIPPVNSNAR